MFDIDNEKAQKIANSFHIPPQPTTLKELQLEQAKPDPCPNAFAEVIIKDVVLSASVLKTVNSPLFGLNRTITDIKQSVMFLGTDNINTLVTFFLLQNSFPSTGSLSLETYWELAMDTANMVNILMDHFELKSDIPAEDAYAFALFRDCGIALLATKYDDYRDVLTHANNSPERIFTDVEDGVYNTNHAIMGYFLSSGWHLPPSLCQYILRHHDDNYLEDKNVSEHDKTLYALIKLAANILNQYKYLRDSCEWFLAKDKVFNFFALSDLDYRDLEEDVKESYAIQFG
jgi:HD-like signal output (HDOD) protein